MKHFVILETKYHNRLSLPIEDITSIDDFTKDECTTVYTEKHFYFKRHKTHKSLACGM